MAKGQKTPPEVIEEVITTVATLDNKAEGGRVLGMPRETIRDIVARMKDDDLAELRRQASNQYIVKTWQNILDIEGALAKKIAQGNISELNLRDITGALKDLKQSIENVVNNIHIGDNIISPDDMKEFEELNKLKELAVSKFGSVEEALKQWS